MPSNNSGLAAGRLDRHSDALGFETSKPDERRREEARLARVNQVKPLAEPEAPQVVQLDTFSRVDVPSSETDHMAKKIQEVLGPFTSFLRMDGYTPPKQPVVDTGQQSTGHSLANSVGASGRHSTKPLASTPLESKRQSSSSQTKLSSNILQPTSSKPTAKQPTSNPTTVSNQTVPLSSSPVAQMVSPRPTKENPVGLSSKEGIKDTSQQVKQHTPPLLVSSKPKPGSSSVVAQSPAKEILLPNSSHLNHASSTLTKSSKHAASSVEHLSASPPSEVTSQPVPPPSTSKDHTTNHHSLHNPKQPNVAPPSALSSSTAPSSSMSPMLPASAYSSPSTYVKASSSPHQQRPKSATPPKSSVSGLNGLNTQHSKLSSSLTTSKKGSLSASSVEKSKTLKLQIPNETNALSKSDLNNIFKEMTEVQPLHSAIETPQKLADRMSFSVSLTTIHETLPTKDNQKTTITKESPDVKQDVKIKGNAIIKDEGNSATTPSVEAKNFNPEELSSSATAKVAEIAKVKQEERAADLPADVEVIKQDPSTTTQQEVATKDVASAVDCDASVVGGMRKYAKSTGKIMRESNDSLLAHDLDISEDSDAESASEDNNTSASQSKKGKVISTSLGAPVKRARSIESSSSSSSSGSDSDSDSASDDDHEDEEDGDKELDKEKSAEQKKSERRSSSSSSNSSSDSSSESDSEEGEEEDEEEKIEADEAVRLTSEKTPSPVYNKPASVGTPNTVDNQDTNRSWGLEHFIPSTKKNSTSPVSASPSKPVSPPSIGSAASVLQAKDTAHPRTLKEIGPCVSMPFDILVSAKHSDEESCNRNADDDNDDCGEVFKNKPSQLQSVRKSSSSSTSELKTKSKDSQSMGSPPIKKHGLSSTSKTSGPDIKQMVPSGRSVERNSSSKKRRSRTGSSSDDEIDVVGYTPEKNLQQPNKVLHKSKQAVTVNLYNGALSSSSDEDNNEFLSTDKNAPNHQPKHHRRKDSGKSDNSSCIDTFKDILSSKGATSVGKASVLPSDLESMYRPPNLLSPIHSAYSPLPEPSTKPLPSFQASFSPAPTNTVTTQLPVVTVSKHGDGVPPAPRIVIRLPKALLNEKQLRRLKEKKDKIRNGGKLSREVKTVDTLRTESFSESQKEARVPPISDIKSLSNVIDNSSIKENDPKMFKRKATNSDADGTSNVPDSLNHKMKKSHKEPSLVSRPTSSTSSVNSDTSSAPDTKSNRLPNLSTDSMLANKSSQSNAVKNLDFASNIPTDPSDDPRTDLQKSSKRKMDNGDESLSKKVKAEPSSEINPSNTSSQPASIRSRRDSAASNSSKGSQPSNKKPSRRSSTGVNKNSHNNNNNNNNIDKSGVRISNNGPDLPFHQYVNGNCRVPSNLPSPQPVETKLQSTEHYLARAKEHKHLADNQRDRLARFEPYLRSGLNFFLAGYTLEHSKKDLNASYNLYNDTSNLLQYVIRMRANSSSNPDSSDRERKLIVLIIRLRSFLNHRLYTLRKPEVSKFKKVIDSEQSKHHSSSSTPATSTAAAAVTSGSSSSNKAHAPSPHQSSWNKNSTGTPSPMSPTPSPATSVSSQGSCELVQGKIPNGSSQISPSPGMVSVQQRVHTVTQRYFALTSHIVKALELWDQADAEARGLEDFFNLVDAACGVLTFHSDPPTIVRYMKHALRLLSL